MATLEELVVKISVEMGDLKARMAEAEASVKGFGDETDNMEKKSSGSLKKLIPSWQAIGAAVAAAAAVLGGAGLKMVQMAADADATTAKFATIFSGMEDSTQAWVDNFVAATGRHKYATMDALSDIQAVSTAMGVEKEAGVEMAKALLERSTDVAAFFNAQDPEVLEAIKSGLTGEMEPLKKYGVILSEANVQQELQNMLGVEGAKVATNAQKVQARTNIILAQTAAIQGQQAREAGSLQEQWKRLSNTLSSTFASAGRDAMQSMTGIITRINQLLGAGGISAIEGVLKRVADGVAWVVGAVLDVVEAFDAWGQSGLYDTLRDFVDSVLDNMTDAFSSAYDAVQEFVGRGGLERLGEAIRIVIQGFADMNRTLNDLGVYDAMGKVIGVIINGLLGFVDVVAYTIVEFDKFKRAVLNTIADVLDAIGLVVPGADEMADGIRDSLRRVPTEAGSAIDGLGPALSGGINDASADAVKAANSGVAGIAGAYGTLPGAVGSGLVPLPGTVSGVINVTGTQATAASRTTVSNVSAEFAKMYGAVGISMNNFPSAVVNPINSTVSPASAAARSVGTGATNALTSSLSPMQSGVSTAMSRVTAAISNSGSAMYSAAASAGMQAVNGMASKMSQMQTMAYQISNLFNIVKAQAAGAKASFDSASYYAGNMPTSGHGGSSSSTGKTGITKQGGKGTNEDKVKIREVHATGGMAGYTGWHWMEKGEVAIPKQYDWKSAVVNPVVNALGGKAGAGAGTVTVNINNRAADVNTTAKTLAKITKASVRAVMV